VLTAPSFLFNPFTLATCIARSTSALTNLFILTAMAKASQGASFTFVLAAAMASYLAMHPILLFPPLMVLLYDAKALKTNSTPDVTSFVIPHTLGFVAAILHGLLGLPSSHIWCTPFVAGPYTKCRTMVVLLH
jgi:phosphatidylinositol glycan class U